VEDEEVERSADARQPLLTAATTHTHTHTHTHTYICGVFRDCRTEGAGRGFPKKQDLQEQSEPNHSLGISTHTHTHTHTCTHTHAHLPSTVSMTLYYFQHREEKQRTACPGRNNLREEQVVCVSHDTTHTHTVSHKKHYTTLV